MAKKINTAKKASAAAPKRKEWNSWARENELKTGESFFVNYKGESTMLTGIWENDTYFLCSVLIPAIPEGCSAEKAKKDGYGVAIKWDCPTHAAALVKMALGAPINKRNRGPNATPSDVKRFVGARLVSVYK